MARFTGVTWDPLGPQTEPAMRVHNILCFHTMAGSFSGTDEMFHANGFKGTESHVGVRADGYAKQWQDVAHTADANLDGNDEVLSIETEDWGGVFGRWDTANPALIPAWTTAQIGRLVDLGVQACLPGTDPRSVHRDCPRSWPCYSQGIPASLIPDTRPGRRGIGYHAQGVTGVGLVAGGVRWSSSVGKVCPGARRIAQLKSIVIPAIAVRVAGGTSPLEDDMPSIEEIAQAAGSGVLGAPIGRQKIGDGSPLTVGIVLSRLYGAAQVEQAQSAALTAAVKALAEQRDVDGDALIAAVRADVQAALKDVTITFSTGA